MHNPVDRDEVLAKIRRRGGVPEKKCFRIISAGRLEEQKGFDRLIRALARLKERGRTQSWFFLEKDASETIWNGWLPGWEFQNPLLMPGFLENPYPWMAGADLFVCSSRSEGMSTVVTEALILGVPVLAVECSGIREQLGMGRFGLMVDNDDEALARALEDFVSGRESCGMAGKGGVGRPAGGLCDCRPGGGTFAGGAGKMKKRIVFFVNSLTGGGAEKICKPC